MTLWLDDGDVRLHHGDCVDVMRALPAESVDAVVCDPPYGLEFMGKAWDSFRPSTVTDRGGAAPGRSEAQPGRWVAVEYGTAKRRTTLVCDACGKRDKFTKPHGCPDGTEWTRIYLDNAENNAATMRAFQVWCEAWAREALRILKPGGHLAAFGGSRTAHRLAAGIEDAGFEIRDTLAWLYGSGFPKSLDVSKAIDKAAGAEREVIGQREVTRDLARNGRTGDEAISPVPVVGTEIPVTAPATPDAERWQGWGTALKPAYEPVILARKPLRGTVAANVLAHGVGALNIDACRIEHTPGDEGVWGATQNRQPGQGGQTMGDGWAHEPSTRNAAGRWPANVALDTDAAAMLDAQTGDKPTGELKRKRQAVGWDGRRDWEDCAYGGDAGGPSRFFYTAKASRAERNDGLNHLPVQHIDFGGEGVPGRGFNEVVHGNAPARAANHHPTVKPVALMRWLCRLVTPPGGVILDPFIGSGSTAVAARAEGFRCWGVDQDATYLEIAAGRLSQLSLFSEAGE